MTRLDLSNRGLATVMEPDDEKKRDALRVRIIGWRGGRGMEQRNAERITAALTQVAGQDVTLDEFLVRPQDQRQNELELQQVRQALEELPRIVEVLDRLEPLLAPLEALVREHEASAQRPPNTDAGS